MQITDQAINSVNSAQERATPEPPSSKQRPMDAMRTLLFGALATVLLLWVALYNGYPSVFPDTGSYLFTGVYHRALWPYRSPVYSVFTSWASLGKSAWFIVVAQAIIAIYVLYETGDYLIEGDRNFRDQCVLAQVCALALLTSLPWSASMLMPDVFAGLAFLCAFLLAFAGKLPLARRIVLALILTISIAAHTSLLPIAGVYIAALVAKRIAARGATKFPSPQSILGWLLLPLLAAGTSTAVLNAFTGAGLSLSPSKNEILLGRLFGDGLAKDFLRENCPTRSFISCRYLSNLPQDEADFMFVHPLLHDLQRHEDEVETIVHETIRSYPRAFAMSCVKQTLLQLAALRVGDEMRSASITEWNYEVIQRLFPRDLPAFRNDRQFLGQMLPLTRIGSSIDVAIFWLSLAACLFFAGTKQLPKVNSFWGSVVLFLIINAAVSGSLSGVYDRYQSRVAWLVPFCLSTYVCCFLKERKRENGPIGQVNLSPERSAT